MKRNGFSLVEMLAVLAIISIILAISTLQFNQMTRKANIEAQTRMLYADLMTVRTQALLQKRDRLTTFSSTLFTAYSSGSGLGTPVLRRSLKYPVIPAGTAVTFSTSGMISWTPSTDPSIAVCVDPVDDAAALDTVVFDQTRLEIGKRTKGKDCVVNYDSTNPNIVTK
jgi:prepilin-type N-terminal cleavage/methylation domain-containing protein